MKTLLIFLSLLVASLDASAQNWSKTVGPVEDDVHDLCIDSNGILYAVTPLGVNRSADGGGHWTRPFLFPLSSLTEGRIMVAANGNIIASADRGIFVSTDGGETFTATRSDSIINPVRQFAVSGTGRIFAALKVGFKMSVDGGLNWFDVPLTGLPGNPSFLAIAAARDTVHAQQAKNPYELFRSVDEGNTWIKVEGAALYLQKLLVHPSGILFNVLNVGFEGNVMQLVAGKWTVFGSEPHYRNRVYTADIMSDGSMLISGQKGIQLVKDLTNWNEVTLGFDKVDTVYRRVTRFIEDTKNNIYYAATIGAGVWKSRTMLEVNTELALPSFHVTPNPAQDRVTIEFTTPEPQPVTLKLYDMLGRMFLKRTETATTGQNIISFDAQSLVPGNYLIVLEVSGEVKTQWVTIL